MYAKKKKPEAARTDAAHRADTQHGTDTVNDAASSGDKLRQATKKYASAAADRRDSLARDFQGMLDSLVGLTFQSLEECQEFCISISALALATGAHLTFQGQPVMVDVGRPRPGFWNVRLRSKVEGPTYKTHVGSSVAFPKLGCRLRVLRVISKHSA